jgi:hypothetical protein
MTLTFMIMSSDRSDAIIIQKVEFWVHRYGTTKANVIGSYGKGPRKLPRSMKQNDKVGQEATS